MKLSAFLTASGILVMLSGCTTMDSANLAVSNLAVPALSQNEVLEKSVAPENIVVSGTQAEDFKTALVSTLDGYGVLTTSESGSLSVTVNIEALKAASAIARNPEYSATISYKVVNLASDVSILEDTIVSAYTVPFKSADIRSSAFSQKHNKILLSHSGLSNETIWVLRGNSNSSVLINLGVTQEEVAFPTDKTDIHSTLGDKRFFYAREGAYRKNILGFLILLESAGVIAQ